MVRLNSKNYSGLLRFLFLVIVFTPSALAQIVIDNAIITNSESIGTSAFANASSVLELSSTTKGLLPPRMTGTQRDAINSPPEALALYNTTTHYLNFWNGSAWKQPLTSGDVVNADIATGAAIAYAKLNLTGSIVNADVATGAAIVYSKLNLATSIVNNDISTGAAIARSKIATGTANRLVVEDASGFLSDLGSLGTTTTILHGNASGPPTFGAVALGTDVTGTLAIANAGTNNPSLAVTNGGMLYTDGSKVVNMGVGTIGQVPVSVGAGAPVWGTTQGGLIGEREYITNTSLEVNSTGWNAYSNAAQATPVNGTGGAPNTTCTRDTTFIITGAGSLALSKTGSANRQGEGCSTDLSAVGFADRGNTMQLEFDYKLASGTFVPGAVGTSPTDSDIEIFFYDTTNSVLIPLTDYKLYVSNLSNSTHFSQVLKLPTNSLGGRVIFHIATTSTANYQMDFDNISLHPYLSLNVSNMSDWQTYTPTLVGFGSATSVTAMSRRVGDSLEIAAHWVNGTPSATTASITLGYGGTNGNVLISSLVPTTMIVGYGGRSPSSVSEISVLGTPAAGVLQFSLFNNATVGTNSPSNGSSISGASESIDIHALIPIAGWTSSSAGVRADQSNFGWTSYTPALTNFGTSPTITNAQYRRQGDSVEIMGNVTFGSAPSGATAIGLPAGLTVDSTKIPSTSYQTIGSVVQDGQGVTIVPIAKGGQTTFGFGAFVGSGTSGLGGPLTVGIAGSAISWLVRIPASGWTENQSAPMLVGTVFSGTGGQERIERAFITNNGTCTATSQSGSWISSLSHPATGQCAFVWASNTWSSRPTCLCTTEDATNYICQLGAGVPTTTGMTVSTGSTVGAANVNFDIICMGQR